jgi:nitroreductase
MDLWEAIESRRSVRHFTDEPVERRDIERLLHAAAQAPSAMNSQPWRFHVCTGESRARVGEIVSQATVHLVDYMDVLGPEHYEEASAWYASLGNAPVVIGVSSPVPCTEFDSMNKMLSVGAAIENLMLSATAQGLGACSVTFVVWARDELAELFRLEEDHEVVGIIALGHPAPGSGPAVVKNEDVADWLG